MKNKTCSQAKALSKIIQKRVQQEWGLGRMFNHIRNLSQFEIMSDLAILRFTLSELQKLGQLPSQEKIKHHFRTKVSKDDYDPKDKRDILRDLYDPSH